MSNTIKILSSEARVHTIAYAYGSSAAGHNVKPLTFRLLPGLNEVNADAWAQAKKLVVVQHYVRTGAFKEVVTKAAGLRGLSAEEAIDMVKQTLDRSLLKEWKGAETREAVISAIELQIDEVTYHPDRDKPAKADDFELPARPAQNGLDGAEIAEMVQTSAPPQPLEEVEEVKPPAPTPRGPATTPPQRGKHSKPAKRR